MRNGAGGTEMKKNGSGLRWLAGILAVCLLLLGACGSAQEPAARASASAVSVSSVLVGPEKEAADAASQAADMSSASSEAVSASVSGTETEAAVSSVSEEETDPESTGDPAEEGPEEEASGESGAEEAAPAAEETAADVTVEEDGTYTSKEEVAAYIHLYGRLPANFISKKEAERLGWNSREGNLWEVAPGMSIGGSRFGNYEGNLPDAAGRQYYECDIDFDGGYRGPKRIVWSNDGLIFYTEDHYETFEQLYG